MYFLKVIGCDLKDVFLQKLHLHTIHSPTDAHLLKL